MVPLGVPRGPGILTAGHQHHHAAGVQLCLVSL
jgi:hypothetical protein